MPRTAEIPPCRATYCGSLSETRSDAAEGRPRIGLITPYAGGNLGDGAIIESARIHLQRFFPNARLMLIVLNGKRASAAHGLDAFPLTAVRRAFYFTDSYDASGLERRTDPPQEWIRSHLKKAAHHAPLALRGAKRLRDFLRGAALEAHHLAAARQLIGTLDGLVVVGGGQLDDAFGGPWGHPYSMVKWTRLAVMRRVPVFFIGTGFDGLRHSLSRRFVCNAVSRAERVSLRDAGSIDLLRAIGVHRPLSFCPDLAFGLPPFPNDSCRMRESTPRPTVGLSPIAYGLPGSWPEAHEPLFNRYWRELESLALSLLGSGYGLTFFATDDPDHRLAQRLYERLKSIRPAGDRLELLPALDVARLLSKLRGFEAVVASRLHGCLLSHLCATPVLAVAYHRKVRAHMEAMGMDRFCFDFNHFNAIDGRRALTQILQDRQAARSSLKAACDSNRKAVESEFATIANELIRKGQ